MKNLIFGASLVIGTPAVAMSDLDAMIVSGNLAMVIASESLCGLSYNQDAIAAWIVAEVPPERMDFANQLNTSIMGAKFSLRDMTGSQKTAHCATIVQTARHYGFIE